MKTVTLGILGGLGPMSGVLFCDMLTRHTLAQRDQDHLNFLLSSRADTPDRTAFILGRSADNPADTMISEVRRLTDAGADVIAIPCNTAHYFYESVSRASSAPVINIIDQTVEFCRQAGVSRVGVLATRGTVSSGAYKTVLESAGIEYFTCTEQEQEIVSNIIYGQIKKGLAPDTEGFLSVCDALRARGCQRLILGCTELSVLNRTCPLGDGFVDSLEVLAVSAIRLCGKEPCGFSDELMKFNPRKDGIYVTQ